MHVEIKIEGDTSELLGGAGDQRPWPVKCVLAQIAKQAVYQAYRQMGESDEGAYTAADAVYIPVLEAIMASDRFPAEALLGREPLWADNTE